MEPRVGMKFKHSGAHYHGTTWEVINVGIYIIYRHLPSGSEYRITPQGFKQNIKDKFWILYSPKQDTLKWIKNYLETSQSTVSSETTESLGE